MVNVVFDTNVWVEHLRTDALSDLIPRLRPRYQLQMDAFVAAELAVGCRSRRERRRLDAILAPFLGTGRIRAPAAATLVAAGDTLARLRDRGVSVGHPAASLIDAAIALNTMRIGAVLVSNDGDFRKISDAVPLAWMTLDEFRYSVPRYV